MSSGTSTAESGPIEYFLKDMATHGRSDRTIEAYERVLRQFQEFIRAEDTGPNGTVTSLNEATYRDCMSWIHVIRRNSAESTVASYASYLNRFYSYMGQVGEFEQNPMALVMEEMSESISTDPTRRDLSVDEMGAFISSIKHPLERVVILTLLKTGIRVGELCNLDVRDVYLAELEEVDEYNDVRAELHGRPNSIFVSSKPQQGAVINGEERTASNKRMRNTVIPIDDELETELVRWLAVRPDPAGSGTGVFLNTKKRWGRRLTPNMVHHMVEKHAREFGWYRSGGGVSENVTPHYFRHFFTTHLRDRTGDRGIVKYLRGDVADDIIDTYTHNWGDRVREVYEENIYRLLVN